MRNLKLYCFLIASTLLSFSTKSLCSDSVIMPSNSQINLLKEDKVTDFIWDDENLSFISIGREYLWIWKVESSKLLRKKLSGEKIAKILNSNQYYWLIGSTMIRMIDKSNLKLRHFDFSRFGNILGASIENEQIYIITEKSVVTIDCKTHKIQLRNKIENSKLSFYHLDSVWTYQNKLELLDNDSKKLVLSCPGSKFEPKAYQSSILYVCKNKIFRFSNVGTLLQVIPIRNKSRLNSWFISNEIHAYHFENRLLELYNPDKISSQKVFLKNLFEKFTIRTNSIIGLSEGIPTIELF